MAPMDVVSWGELWFVNLGPVALYLAVIWYSYRLHHKPGVTQIYWIWAFLAIKLAIIGAMIVRVQSLFYLWHVGRAGAWEATNPEHLIGAWLVGLGLFFHVLLLDRHPFWQHAAAAQQSEESR